MRMLNVMVTFNTSMVLLLRVNLLVAALVLLMLLEVGTLLMLIHVAISGSVPEPISGSMSTLKPLRALRSVSGVSQ